MKIALVENSAAPAAPKAYPSIILRFMVIEGFRTFASPELCGFRWLQCSTGFRPWHERRHVVIADGVFFDPGVDRARPAQEVGVLVAEVRMPEKGPPGFQHGDRRNPVVEKVVVSRIQGSVMNLSRSKFTQVVLACMSVQNHFWFYDEREMSLIRVDAQLRPTAHTGRIDQLLGFAVRPVSMQEHENWLYMHDPEHGLLVFDLFGTYARTIPLLNMISFEVRGEKIYFFGDEGARIYDKRSFEITPLEANYSDQAAIKDMRVEIGRAYLLLDDKILIIPLSGQ